QSKKFICGTASLPGNLTLVLFLLVLLLLNLLPLLKSLKDPLSLNLLSYSHIHSFQVFMLLAIDHESLFLYTRNLVPGVQSLDQDEVVFSVQDEDGGTVEYREWDPYKSRLAAAIFSGAQDIWIKPGSRVLVIDSRDDAQFGITISHISDIVGPQGMVYVVEESNGKSLLDMADKRFNIVPIVLHNGDPRMYRMLINLVDVLFAALDRPEEVTFPLSFNLVF
ncbi:hypothetical protein TSUD_421400, partial [Trifolium subterraneum]